MHLDKCKGGFQYAMVVTDHFTRFCQIYGTKKNSSKAAADKLFNEFVLQFGYPERIHSDQGGEFTNHMIRDLQRLTGIKASTTTPYHPMGDGQAERLNRTVCNMLKSLSESAKKDWRNHLPKLAFAYNSTINKTTGFSPFYLMFGRESRLPIDRVFHEVRSGKKLKRKTHEEFVREWEQSMKDAVEVARNNIKKSAGYNKKYYDRKAKAVELIPGDMVLMKNTRERGGTGKMRSFWEESIFKIVEKREKLPVYKIQSIKNDKDVRVVHRNLLLQCNELPMGTFEEEKKAPKQRTLKRIKKSRKKEPQESEEESDEEVVIVQQRSQPSREKVLVLEEELNDIRGE